MTSREWVHRWMHSFMRMGSYGKFLHHTHQTKTVLRNALDAQSPTEEGQYSTRPVYLFTCGLNSPMPSFFSSTEHQSDRWDGKHPTRCSTAEDHGSMAYTS